MKCTYLPLTLDEKIEEQKFCWPFPICELCGKNHISWDRRIKILLTKDDTFKQPSPKIGSNSNRGEIVSIEISTILQNLRKRLGYTKTKIASMIDKRSEYWIGIENYGYRPSLEVMMLIESNLGIPFCILERFWRGSGNKYKKSYSECDMSYSPYDPITYGLITIVKKQID